MKYIENDVYIRVANCVIWMCACVCVKEIVILVFISRCHNRLLMTSQWPDNCDAITRIAIYNSLDIDFCLFDQYISLTLRFWMITCRYVITLISIHIKQIHHCITCLLCWLFRFTVYETNNFGSEIALCMLTRTCLMPHLHSTSRIFSQMRLVFQKLSDG